MSVIGIDVGGTWIKAARFTDDLQQVEERIRIRSGAQDGIEAFFACIIEVLTALLSDAKTPVGLALPGVLTRDGQAIHFLANVAGMDTWQDPGIIIRDELAKRGYDGQFAVANDATCAALGEWQFGLPQGDPEARLLHITWGTGIGTGFVVDGDSQYGWEGGHIPLDIEPRGSTVESEIQTSALLRRARELLRAGGTTSDLVDTLLFNPIEGSKHLVAMASAGDALAQQVLQEAAATLAHGLHVMALLAYPTAVTIGGGIMTSDWLLDQVRYGVDRLSVGIRTTSLIAAMIHRAELGNDAGMIGAAILALRHSG